MRLDTQTTAAIAFELCVDYETSRERDIPGPAPSYTLYEADLMQPYGPLQPDRLPIPHRMSA